MERNSIRHEVMSCSKREQVVADEIPQFLLHWVDGGKHYYEYIPLYDMYCPNLFGAYLIRQRAQFQERLER